MRSSAYRPVSFTTSNCSIIFGDRYVRKDSSNLGKLSHIRVFLGIWNSSSIDSQFLSSGWMLKRRRKIRRKLTHRRHQGKSMRVPASLHSSLGSNLSKHISFTSTCEEKQQQPSSAWKSNVRRAEEKRSLFEIPNLFFFCFLLFFLPSDLRV